MSRGRSLVLLVLLAPVLVTASVVEAQEPAEFEPVDDADPMRLARLAARVGDAEVLLHLSDPVRSHRLSAIRATPWMVSPESALGALVELAAGRDPVLAPESARAALRIAMGLSLDQLERREADVEELAAARERFGALGSDATARADIRAAAASIAGLLSRF